MDTTMLLCDYAEAVNGKLYITGGGWNILYSAGQPFNASIAALIAVPWDQANRRHQIALHLLTPDGEAVAIDGNPVTVTGDFEVGRPPGVKPGSDLNAPFVWNFGGLTLELGRYEWRLEIDGATAAHRAFDIVPHPGVPHAAQTG